MYWLVALVIAGGASLSLQAAVNARLGRELGSPALAAFVSFLVGTLALAAYALGTRSGLPGVALLARVPGWAWLGGILGAFYVALVIVAIPRLGVAVTMSLVVAGQVLLSVFLDQFGLLGVERHPLTPARLLGVMLVALGAALVRRF
jgi:transporter family-2 protein